MGAWDWWHQGDMVARGTAVLLLAMSVLSWVLILWKAWLLAEARRSVPRSIALWWQSPDLQTAGQRVQAADRTGWVAGLVAAAAAEPAVASPSTLEARTAEGLRLTRRLRAALQQAQQRLQAGQTLLATLAAAAPFVGLLGTVWGIHRALLALTGGGPVTLDRLAAPVGEALVMTALGLAVAIPALVAYNLLGRGIEWVESELDALAHDLQAWAVATPADAAALQPSA